MGEKTTERTTQQILCDEAASIHGATLDPADPHLYSALKKLDSAAICLSGGGIRSAAFGLGVIQALATHPRTGPSGEIGTPVGRAQHALITSFHYLSTVSGGGYIGSWLSAWRMNEPFPSIWESLVPRPGRRNCEPRQIGWLRSYSNYLTPKIGISSADTWTALALWVRNLLLNWLVIILPICAAVFLFKIVGLASTWVILWPQGTGWYPHWDTGAEWLFYIKLALECGAAMAAVPCLIKSLAFTVRVRPTCRLDNDPGPDRIAFARGALAWSVASAFLLVHLLASDLAGNLLLQCNAGGSSPLGFVSICGEHEIVKQQGWNVARYPMVAYLAVGAAAGAVIYFISWRVARPHGKTGPDLWMWTSSGLAYGALIATGLYIYLVIPDEGVRGLPVYFMHLVFGVTWILMAQLLAQMLFLGLSSFEPSSDADREWFGRAGGWTIAAAVIWLGATFLVYFGAISVSLVGADVYALSKLQDLAPAIAAVSGIGTAVFGTSNMLPVKGPAEGVFPSIIASVLPLLTIIFGAALVISISYGFDELLFSRPSMLPDFDRLPQFQWDWAFLYLWIGFAVSAAGAWIASWTININRFSLHAIYRNRLVRAFLGASRQGRNPDRFTGFDAADNPRMHDLWSPAMARQAWAPFHIINIALNVVSSRNLAWQERKAESFTVSALHSGSGYLGYRDSEKYGGGITLGTAMAISGAAASPNMGYHSSPAVTFLMTMLNVRLGWWFGNPGPAGESTFDDEGPAFAITPLVQEALGLTTDDRAYVYLSDGGHFENLGLYEMVRRRCRYIVVADAGCDPHFKFEDLANAVRKIAIDLGIDISFKNLERLRPRPQDGRDVGHGHPYHAIGEIDYGAADGAKPDDDGGRKSFILYIKAAYHGTESAGIRGYAKVNPEFPHQPTIDQWFTESQFESYRALGFELADSILNEALWNGQLGPNPTLEQIFDALYKLP